MAPKYKLMYFDGRGRAEVSRMLFAQAGVEYEDCRLTQDEFKAIKGDITKCPLGQLPVLVVDYNKIPIAQSRAIERHLARTFGMLGKNEMDTTRIDIVSECVADLFTQIIKVYFEKDATKKAEMQKDFIEKGSVPILTAVSKGIMRNNEGKGYCIGDVMTLADIEVFNVTQMMYKEFPILAEKYPVLKAFNDRMKAEPKIAAWLAKRPDTSF